MQRDSRGRIVKGTHWREPKPHWQREWLFREYVERERSTGDIAVEIGTTDANVLYWLKRHGIPRRTVSAARAIKHWGVVGEANPMHGKTGAANPRYVDGSSPDRQRMYVQAKGARVLARDTAARRLSMPALRLAEERGEEPPRSSRQAVGRESFPALR